MLIRPLAQQTAPAGQSEALVHMLDPPVPPELPPLLALPPKDPLLAPVIPLLPLTMPPLDPPLPSLIPPPPLLEAGSPCRVGPFAPSAALEGPASDPDTVNSLPPHAANGKKPTTVSSMGTRRAPMLATIAPACSKGRLSRRTSRGGPVSCKGLEHNQGVRRTIWLSAQQV